MPQFEYWQPSTPSPNVISPPIMLACFAHFCAFYSLWPTYSLQLFADYNLWCLCLPQVATLKSIIETCHAEAFKADTRAKGYTLAVVKACESQIPTLFQALVAKPENTRLQKVRDLKEKYFPDAFPYEVAAKEQREAAAKAASSVRGAAEADAFGIPPASKGAMTATAHWTALSAYIEAFETEKMGWRDDKKADGWFLSEKAKEEAKFAFERVLHWSEEHPSHKPRIQKFGLRLRMAFRPEALTLIPAAALQEPEPAAQGLEPATGGVQSGSVQTGVVQSGMYAVFRDLYALGLTASHSTAALPCLAQSTPHTWRC